jgi:hypothetical protein
MCFYSVNPDPLLALLITDNAEYVTRSVGCALYFEPEETDQLENIDMGVVRACRYV